MKVTFIIETAEPDSDGNIIELDGVEFKQSTPVCVAYNLGNLVGVATVFKEGDYLKATCELDEKYWSLFPAIGFETIRSTDMGSYDIFNQIKLRQIGLCDSPNLNPAIKTIREQLNQQG